MDNDIPPDAPQNAADEQRRHDMQKFLNSSHCEIGPLSAFWIAIARDGVINALASATGMFGE